MDDSAIRFARAARTADVAMFYYSGHALQFGGTNYLAPVDAKLSDEADLRRMIRVDDMVADLQQAKNLRILVLDSCRDNPLAEELRRSIGSTRAIYLQRGLAKVDSPQGMILAYATQAGRTAEDGNGRNSPYTTAFLKHIEAQEEIGTIFRRISTDVYEATNHAQLPELSLSLVGEFYFRGRLTLSAPQAVNPCAEAAEHWKNAEMLGTKSALEDHLAKFPSCDFAERARARIDGLKDRAQASTTAQPPLPNNSCSNPSALGIGRVVQIDTTGGPGFGFQHFKENDFLRDREVVLTFDDGPWPRNTPAVLKALADQCTTGIFFAIGKNATYEPDILKQVYAAGHTIGAHTWSHANLNDKKLTDLQKKNEIEKSFSAVKWALGGISPAPFFRFPALQHPPDMLTYLGTRNIAIFSCDVDSFDFKAPTPEKVVDTVMKKLNTIGKGIILMHDFQKHTAEALPELLKRLKAGGYKVVAIRAKSPATTLPEYDQELLKDVTLPTVSQRPVNGIATTINE